MEKIVQSEKLLKASAELERYLQNIYITCNNIMPCYISIFPEEKRKELKEIRNLRNLLAYCKVSLDDLDLNTLTNYTEYLLKELEWCKENKELVVEKLKAVISEKK